MKTESEPVTAVRVVLPAADEDLATAILWAAGTHGIEVQPAAGGAVALLSYFTARPDLLDEVRAALAGLTGASVDDVAVPDVDWVARFREGFRAFAVGSFLVAPVWDRPAALSPGQRLLVLDPGRAFGTGTHETTRLCLGALEQLAARRALGRTLDVGTGTGILALAAAALGASAVVGVDNDPEAVAAARRHAALNATPLHVVFGDGASPFAPGAFDLVVANVTAPVLRSAREAIASVRAPGGTIVLSGLLDADVEEMRAAYAALGAVSVRTDGEWAALVVEGAS